MSKDFNMPIIITKEEQNIKVHGFIDGGCWHKVIECRKVSTDFGMRNLIDCSCGEKAMALDWFQAVHLTKNPKYLTMNGIGLIREWLIKKRWDLSFAKYIAREIDKTLPIESNFEHVKLYFDIYTDPEKFIPKFIEYMEKD